MKNLRAEDEIIANWKGDIEQPVVSICCITYNHEPYIEDALEGFLIQETDFPFEILIHDDASTDRTANIIREYEAKYPRLIKPVYQTENQFSKGLKINPTFNFPRAKGEYIALCEGDDYWADVKKISIQKKYLDSEKDCVICYGKIIPFNKDGNLFLEYQGVGRDLSRVELKNLPNINTMTVMFRNVLKFNVPKEFHFTIYGDKMLWFLLSDFGKGGFVDELKPVMYRVHDGGIHSLSSEKEKLYEYIKLDLAVAVYSLKNKMNGFAFKYFLKAVNKVIRYVV